MVGEVDERLRPHTEEHRHPRTQRDGQPGERRDRDALGPHFAVVARGRLVLLEGSATGDPLFLQCKQAGPSVYESYTYSSGHDNHGARVIAGKRMVQSATDIFVGWGSLGERDFYVRQFRDMKLIPTTELIAPVLVEFAIACGNSLARAHARSGDPAAIDAYIGKSDVFTKAMRRFARRYADQNERDHAALLAAIRKGKAESILD